MIRITRTQILSVALCLFCGVSIADNTPQVIRTDVFQLAHRADSLLVDMNIDLTPIQLAPDCSLFLLPTLYRGADSLHLAPVLLNGSQSDRVYRRRKALRRELTDIEKVTPYLILRKGEHAFPRINYQTAVPHRAWMDSADIKLTPIYCNCNKRATRFDMRTFRTPALARTLIEKEKVTVHDTIYVPQTMVVHEPAPTPAKHVRSTTNGTTLTVDDAYKEVTIYFNQKWHRRWQKDRHILAAVDSLLLMAGSEKKLSVQSYTSPQGSYKANERLAIQRALTVRQLLENRFGVSNVQVTVHPTPEGWELFAHLLGQSKMTGREEVLEIIRQTSDYEQREELLKALNAGTIYKYMLTEFFPKLHKVVIRATN